MVRSVNDVAFSILSQISTTYLTVLGSVWVFVRMQSIVKLRKIRVNGMGRLLIRKPRGILDRH